MEFTEKQREIDAILKTLDEAKRYSGLGADDPSVIELERIMMAKVTELEAAKIVAAQAVEAAPPDPPPVLFAATEEEPATSPIPPPPTLK
jgi:hypothetical protein